MGRMNHIRGVRVVLAACVLAAAACSSNVSTAGTATTTTSTAGAPSTSAAGGTTTSPGTVPIDAPATGAAKPSKGCGTSTVKALDNDERTLTVGGVERQYLLTTPPAHDGRTPLALVLDHHGLSEGMKVHTQMSGFGEVAKKEGFVVAFPQGAGVPVHWDITKAAPNNDLDFIDALIDTLGQQLCLDLSRVYSAGLSYGAIWSSFLTCHRADRFAAVGTVAGITMPKDCNPTRPMPVIAFHGTADPILSFNGGTGSALSTLFGKKDPNAPSTTAAPTTTVPPDLTGAGYPKNTADWAARNGCQATFEDTDVTANVIKRVYDCPAAASVEFYIIKGGGHAWPGSAFSAGIEKIVGPTTFDINASELIWKFFERFQLPT